MNSHSQPQPQRVDPCVLIAICLLLVVSHSDARPFGSYPLSAAARYSGTAWGLGGHPSSVSPSCASASCLVVPRGGSEAPAEKEEDDEEEEEEDDEEEEDEEDEDNKKKDITSMEPLTVVIKTNLGSQVVDQSLELTAVRTRNVESLKKNLARKLPGKPPIEMIRLLQHGQVLQDDVLVDELLEDDDEEDDEEEDDTENKPALTLTLDMVPPVDIRYSTELEEQLPELSTAELLEAYTLTEAAIWFSSQLVVADETETNEDEDEESSPIQQQPPTAVSPLISFQLRQYATTLQSQLQEHLFTEKATALLEDPVPPAKAEAERARQPQIRGQRVRPGAGGAVGTPASSSVVGLKQTAQHYLNIHWGDTIRNFCLFLFFGWFGGRTVTSRALLLLGAPLCFIVQARPVKLWYKELLYMVLRNPPSIILSLLPAPQQAMLSLSDEDALRMIYGDDAPAVEVPEEDEKGEFDYDVMEDAEDDDDDDEYDEDEEYDDDDEEDF